ncbi:MAG: precorrin-6y C5,15-methyltransferase (decarboxylating) subunit CbiE [Paenirhodobacter sp.]|uniref:precorrin-6y C5,15-methyltransferase (decarboxylating) subunit CbiE n=1 Tax=Paenirhodobacter sp. TaxID=1965326 RepID=UPI003D12906F
MADPWLSLIGLGEDGLNGLCPASRAALDRAEIVFGGARHLALADVGARGQAWPLPFSVAPVLALRGHPVAVLASGDPFWHGVGGTLAPHLAPGEWRAFPAPSSFALAAARLGWRLEEVDCLGLHAAPFARLVPVLAPGVRVICLMRDGAAPAALAEWLVAQGFGASRMVVLEALGGPRERLHETRAEAFAAAPEALSVSAPVAVAIEGAGAAGLSRASGLPDALFATDGMITKRPVRAMTLSALAPRPGALLWDIGAGSGSISVEWCRAAPGARAIALEPDDGRRGFVAENAARFGLAHRIEIRPGRAPEALSALPAPDAVFFGGGVTAEGIAQVLARLHPGGRLLCNSVTLESEALLIESHLRFGGSLLKIELAEAAPFGRLHGWTRARPILQWSLER